LQNPWVIFKTPNTLPEETVDPNNASDRPKKQAVVQALGLLLILSVLLGIYFAIQTPALETTQFTLKRQSGSFLLISTLKSSLSIIEGSDIGIGFRLEVGDIVQSALDLVDFTWKIVLYGILLITFSKIFLESNLIHIGVFILTAGFVVNLIGLFVQPYREKALSAGSGIIVFGLIVAFYVPVSTLVSFRACEYFVSHIETDLDRQMEDVLEEWERFKTKFSSKELETPIQTAASYVKELFLKLTQILIAYTVLIIIRYLFFPIIVAYGFFIIARAFLNRRFN